MSIEVSILYFFEVLIRTGSILCRYYSIIHFPSIAFAIINSEELCGVRKEYLNSNSLRKKQLPGLI